MVAQTKHTTEEVRKEVTVPGLSAVKACLTSGPFIDAANTFTGANTHRQNFTKEKRTPAPK